MTLSLKLPDDVAARLNSLPPEEDQDGFSVTAIAEALEARQLEGECRLADALLAEIDPHAEPERDAVECQAAINVELSDANPTHNTVSLDEVRIRRSAGSEFSIAYR